MKKFIRFGVFGSYLLLLLGMFSSTQAAPLGTAFTYQGRLTDGSSPANGIFDFRFLLYDSLVGGNQVGPIIDKEDETVSNGLFMVQLDFGNGIFTGNARYLEIHVRPGTSTGSYTNLAPRQALSPVPYALTATNGPQGPQGIPGPQGPQGPQGAQGIQGPGPVDGIIRSRHGIVNWNGDKLAGTPGWTAADTGCITGQCTIEVSFDPFFSGPPTCTVARFGSDVSVFETIRISDINSYNLVVVLLTSVGNAGYKQFTFMCIE